MGTTASHLVRWCRPAVHPHVRGDHVEQVAFAYGQPGSSPRAWGPLGIIAGIQPGRRFIPTCVGTTTTSFSGHDPRAVHPHVRGDHEVFRVRIPTQFGSSPRAWGPHDEIATTPYEMRFIPTCVGTTPVTMSRTYPASVHPHVRGDHGFAQHWADETVGSSPRAWGPQGDGPNPEGLCRFIPTCVGTTCNAMPPCRMASVHPHVRGDHKKRQRRNVDDSGSSPRAWGPHDVEADAKRAYRFIPTCVGTTRLHGRAMPNRPVHPHVRGDHESGASIGDCADGSSPRAWGPRNLVVFFLGLVRFIPTCVGTTWLAP